jgi:spore coat polysaccharide biosynthesis protein SpsF (cytidylyltransferase family)
MTDDRSAIIIQARMSSERFPGKMLSAIDGMPLIDFIYKRCMNSSVKEVLIATSDDKSDDVLFEHCRQRHFPVTRGSLDNVLKRYIDAAGSIGADYICRVCGDTPLIDITLMDMMLNRLIKDGLDLIAPDRQSCSSCFYSQAVSLEALKKSQRLTKDRQDLEHVTRFILRKADIFSIRLLDTGLNPMFLKNRRLTIDYPQDLDNVNRLLSHLDDRLYFNSDNILKAARELFTVKDKT